MKTIAIIGGGLGGLALAQAFKGTQYKVTVYERDVLEGERAQGYVIGLNKDGLAALRTLELDGLEQMINHNRTYHFNLVNPNLDSLVKFKNSTKGTTKQDALVNRWEVRDLLTKGVDIVWNKRFERYEDKEDHVVAYFEDGTQITCDLLVGADGTQSRVRNQRKASLQLKQLDYQQINADLSRDLFANLPEKLSKLLDDSLVRVMSTNVLPYKNENNEMAGLWTVSRRFDTDLTEKSAEENKEELLRNEWHPDIAEMIRNTPIEAIGTYKRMKCIDMSNANNCSLGKTTRITLLGDAAHAMTTQAGLGANTAFGDAIKLKEAIVASGPWENNLKKYEEEMMKRGAKNNKQSLGMTTMIHYTGWKGSLRNGFFSAFSLFV